jgi:hypothetical protein
MNTHNFLLYKKNIDNILYYKKNINTVLSCNEIIINSYESILDMLIDILNNDNSDKDDTICEIVNIREIIHEHVIKKTEAELELNNCDEMIYQMCKHNFVEDYIDITPDISQKIIYCSICELSKK